MSLVEFYLYTLIVTSHEVRNEERYLIIGISGPLAYFHLIITLFYFSLIDDITLILFIQIIIYV